MEEELERYRSMLETECGRARDNLQWLFYNMHPYFFITMREDPDAVIRLSLNLLQVGQQQKVTIADHENSLMLARRDLPGSLYDTLKDLQERDISYAEMTHSLEPLPNSEAELEVQRFEFERKSHGEVSHLASRSSIPRAIRNSVAEIMRRFYPGFDFKQLDELLRVLYANNPGYVKISPPERLTRALWLFQQGRRHDGLYLDVERAIPVGRYTESRILFSVGNQPQRGFITQMGEIFNQLNIGVRRLYCLNISTGIHPYFLGTFYVTPRDGGLIEKGSGLFRRLQRELYNTQILSIYSDTYRSFVSKGVMTGVEGSLTQAFISFCHTTLAHTQPDRFGPEAVSSAFLSTPGITRKLIETFRIRFEPQRENRAEAYRQAHAETRRLIDAYNTGHRYLDDLRKTIFTTCLLFIHHTLKTNFFVPEKHALSFRLDPAFLKELDPEFSEDLPRENPFRITFFFGRYGLGYHIGFSDIARGGWRTIICRSKDEYLTYTNTLFREVYVLAHTQHLKNKDIYEGGSKMVVVLDATDTASPDAVTQRLYKLQYGLTNAFLDIFVTDGEGVVQDPRIVDYYREEEPVELGPDENMHDVMVEQIARQSVKRGYLLGVGIISSKRAGINHKAYGVTSRGVVKFAEIAMRELGVDILSQPFTVKITGGTSGDVAGNAIRLLLERCPQVRIRCIVAGSGAAYDPEGLSPAELKRLTLSQDTVDFDPSQLHPRGFILFRRQRRTKGLQELHKKIRCTAEGKIQEEWITADSFNREFEDLIFTVRADLFLPCGGRPETIDSHNWHRLFAPDGAPHVRVIAEGANSYITPEARERIQERGVILLRDASANKCGVISSSYEIISNLLMNEREFLSLKEKYIGEVLEILDKRAEEEAKLIFTRYRESSGKRRYTQISHAIAADINRRYAQMFSFFMERPELADKPLFRRALLAHLPAVVAQSRKYRQRVNKLPVKIKNAILASEIASRAVYQGGWEPDLESRITEFVKRTFSSTKS